MHTTVTEAQTMADLATTQMPFSQTLVGKYRQVDMWNMEAFLKAEGGGFMYQVRVNFAVSFGIFVMNKWTPFSKRLALAVTPDLEIKQYSKV